MLSSNLWDPLERVEPKKNEERTSDMKILAIDPGKNAPYAKIDTRRPTEAEVGEFPLIGDGRYKRPCPIAIARVAAGCDVAIVERIGAMTNQGVSSTFTFGLATGAVLAPLSIVGVPLETIAPSPWKKSAGITSKSKEEQKREGAALAVQLYPQLEPILRGAIKSTSGGGKHGISDCIHMARWYYLSGPGQDVLRAERMEDLKGKVNPEEERQKREDMSMLFTILSRMATGDTPAPVPPELLRWYYTEGPGLDEIERHAAQAQSEYQNETA